MPAMQGTRRLWLRWPAASAGKQPAMTAQRQSAAELTIGIVGPHDLVERIMLSGSPQASGLPGGAVHPAAGPAGASGSGTSAAPARRLVAAAYRSEQEAADRVLRLGPGIDACLFASQVP